MTYPIKEDKNINSDASSTEDNLQSFITSIVFMGTADKAELYGEIHTAEIFISLNK